MHSAKFHAGWEAMNRRDIESVLDLLHPEIEWDVSNAFPDGPVYHGHEGVCRWYADMENLWDAFAMELDELHQRGDNVVVVGHWSARGKGSSVPVRSPGGWFWRMRESKATLMRFYADPADALAALQPSGRFRREPVRASGLAPAVPAL